MTQERAAVVGRRRRWWPLTVPAAGLVAGLVALGQLATVCGGPQVTTSDRTTPDRAAPAAVVLVDGGPARAVRPAGPGTAPASRGGRSDPAAAPAPRVAPAGDAFYLPPSPLPAGRPGDIIWYRPAPLGPLGVAEFSHADVWQVLYLSTDVHGRPDAVSGTVLVPKGSKPGGLPLVGFAPGTHGIGDDCAPSKALAQGLDYELAAVQAILDRGWAVAETDYEGLGTPTTHTYMIGRSQGAALLDVVRAARRLPPAGLSARQPVALYGYSQGGGASGWAAQLQPTYAPELPLKAVVAGGVPADLAVVAKNLDGGLGFAFLGMSAVGLNAAYPELNLDRYLTAAGRSAMADAATMCVGEALATYGGRSIADYTTTNPLNRPDWSARVDEQKLGRIAPQVPVFLAHGLQDEFIPYDQAVQLRRDWCAAGARVHWQDFVGEHASTMLAMQPDALAFIQAGFAGLRMGGTC